MQAQTSSLPSEMTDNDAGFGVFVEQEESSIMESPKRESSEWTDEKHGLYLKSMEASFIDQLYNSLDRRSLRPQNNFSSDTMSSRRNNAGARRTSGQFKVLQHGFWSRMDFRRESSVIKEADRPHVSSSNPWIQNSRNKSKYGGTESLSPQQNPSSTAASQQFHESDSQFQTSCNNKEVMDQNFAEEDSAIENTNTPCCNKRKR